MNNSKISILLETISSDDHNPFAHFALAREYQKVSERTLAREQYQHLIDHFPEYGGTYYHYVNFLLDDAELETAQAMIERGMDILRKNNEIHLLNELSALRDQYFEIE